jgi:NADH dehydrogenase (ubiquinone) 1 beta subcomplex subunit 9
MFSLQMLDMWHPLERAQYPEYFKRRDQRKQEYIEKWEKTHGTAPSADH